MSPTPPWYATPRALRLLSAGLAALLLCNAVLSIGFKVTDFEWHLEKGWEFLTARPYPVRYLTYPLPRLLLDAVVAPLEPVWARAVAYPFAVALLAWCTLVWARLAAGGEAVAWRRALPALGALLVLHPYLTRDLNDCGPQIVTLALLTAALLALRRGRPLQAGFWLATAFAWKATPLLFLPYLLLKRQWLAAAAMAGFTLLWFLLPAAVVGWEAARESYRLWIEQTLWILQQPDLTVLGYEAPRHQNQALRMVVARYLTSFDGQHPIHAGGDLSQHPLYLQFGALSAAAAAQVHQVLLLLLGGLFAWRFRRAWHATAGAGGAADGGLAQAREWAAVLLLMTLIGPSAWLHHFAVALPAAILAGRDLLAAAPERRWWGRWRLWLCGFVAIVVLLLQRDVVQRELSLIVLAYKFDAFAMWALVALALLPPRRESEA